MVLYMLKNYRVNRSINSQLSTEKLKRNAISRLAIVLSVKNVRSNIELSFNTRSLYR